MAVACKRSPYIVTYISILGYLLSDYNDIYMLYISLHIFQRKPYIKGDHLWCRQALKKSATPLKTETDVTQVQSSLWKTLSWELKSTTAGPWKIQQREVLKKNWIKWIFHCLPCWVGRAPVPISFVNFQNKTSDSNCISGLISTSKQNWSIDLELLWSTMWC